MKFIVCSLYECQTPLQDIIFIPILEKILTHFMNKYSRLIFATSGCFKRFSFTIILQYFDLHLTTRPNGLPYSMIRDWGEKAVSLSEIQDAAVRRQKENGS